MGRGECRMNASEEQETQQDLYKITVNKTIEQCWAIIAENAKAAAAHIPEGKERNNVQWLIVGRVVNFLFTQVYAAPAMKCYNDSSKDGDIK